MLVFTRPLKALPVMFSLLFSAMMHRCLASSGVAFPILVIQWNTLSTSPPKFLVACCFYNSYSSKSNFSFPPLSDPSSFLCSGPTGHSWRTHHHLPAGVAPCQHRCSRQCMLPLNIQTPCFPFDRTPIHSRPLL